MSKKMLETLSLMIILMAIALGIVLVLNLENIKLLTTKSMEIDSKEDYSLEELKDKDHITISGTPNNLFESRSDFEGEEILAFSLKEYIFDFIVIAGEGGNATESFSCLDVTDSEEDLLDELISQFNSPVNLDSLMSETDDLLDEESKNTILQNTIGQFGDATRLLDCKSVSTRTSLEIYFLLTTEFIFLTGCLFFFFRKRILYFVEELKEEIEEEIEKEIG